MGDLTFIAAPGLGQLRRYTFGVTDPALSPLAACAATGALLWSDDAALRGLAAQHGVPAFGTVALLQVLAETGRADDTLRQDVLTLARGSIGDLMLTHEELMSLAAENGYQPGPATLIVSRPLFWASPDDAQVAFTEIAARVNRDAPVHLTAWFKAACTGLAARLPGPESARRAVALAEAVATRIQAEDEVRVGLINAATNVVRTQAQPC
jgi:hypothetical protein